MKKIVKNREPNSLTRHRSQRGNFDNLPTNDKNELRDSLLREQGYICCYCMKRIPEKNDLNLDEHGCKIEHFKCQNKNSNLELVYSNLMISCLGGESKPEYQQTCDSFKKNKTLSHNPSYAGFNESLIYYSSDGGIHSTDETLDNELNKILNLNKETLSKNRESVYMQYQEIIERECSKNKEKKLKVGFLMKHKRSLLDKQDGKYIPFCMIGVYYIDKKLRKLSN